MAPPLLEFDKDIGEIKVSGESIELEVTKFWNPLRDQVKDYLQHPRDIHFIVALEYFNTPAAHRILELCKYIENRCVETKRQFTVTWVYEDEDMKSAGDHYASILKKGTIFRFREESL